MSAKSLIEIEILWKFEETSHTREIRNYPAVTFPNMNDFSAEYLKDLIITQRKTHSEANLSLKERFLDKKGFSSRSVWRFCFKNEINLHNRLSNDELERCTWDVVARVGIGLLDVSACCYFILFFLSSFPCLYSRLYEHPSRFKIIFRLYREFVGFCQS